MPVGSNICDLNPVDLRSHIAMAIQSPGMKVDSIRANCIYGSEKMFEVNNQHHHDQNELEIVRDNDFRFVSSLQSRTRFSRGYSHCQCLISG